MADYLKVKDLLSISTVSDSVWNCWIKENAKKHFIETGTKYGYTTRIASLIFENVHTIELNEAYHVRAKDWNLHRDGPPDAYQYWIDRFVEKFGEDRYKYPYLLNGFLSEGKDVMDKKIKYHLGDSVKILPIILSNIQDNATFFFDAHKSGDSGDVDVDVPLLKELNIIREKRKNNNDIIIIDDVRLFGSNDKEDWSKITIENIRESIGVSNIKEEHVLNDRLILLTGK